MDQVGVRDLKQNASAVLERVRHGEAVEVTVRGEPVAVLVPVRSDESVLDRLIREGKATPATKRLGDLPPRLPAHPGAPSLAEILDEQRAERL